MLQTGDVGFTPLRSCVRCGPQEANPDNEFAQYNLGNTLSKLERWGEAVCAASPFRRPTRDKQWQ